jgi:Outer membrane protein beta-barrel domain
MSISSRALRLLVPARLSMAAAAAVAAAPLVVLPGVAHAQDSKDCPPGSWFCGDTQPPPSGTAGSGVQALPPPEAKPAETRPATPPPPVVVYQPGPIVVQQPREAPPAYYYVPRKAPSRREWGLNLHLGGLMMGKGQDNNAGMGVAGLGLRFRPVPAAALEVDLDFAGGRDYNGFRRNETALSFNGLLFVNPKNATQVYFLAGFGWSGATAVDDRNYDSITYKYGYFGVQGGVGLEFRLSRAVALNVDVRGFVRGRVDDNRRDYYEFVDSSGRRTNSSGGGQLQGGLTFYW